MNCAEELAERIAKYVSTRCNVTVGTRDDIKAFVQKQISPVIQTQALLSFEDAEALKGQSEEILRLLRSRGSVGATNAELSEISLKYTSRVSDLRKSGHAIVCSRLGESRTYNYVLG